MYAGLIDEAVTSFFDQLNQRLHGAFDWLTDPFWWHYLPLGIAIIVGAVAAAWFFPVLRSLAGAIVFAIVGGLFAYRKGELDEKARHKPAPKPPTPPQRRDW